MAGMSIVIARRPEWNEGRVGFFDKLGMSGKKG